jgi:hypothetical protein
MTFSMNSSAVDLSVVGKRGGGPGYGAKKAVVFQETVHTATALSLVLGIGSYIIDPWLAPLSVY